MLRKLLFGVAVGLVVLGCLIGVWYWITHPPISEGFITKKWHEDARLYTTVLPMTISNGKTVTTVLVPYVVYDDEDWCITITDVVDGKTKWRTLYISESTYNSVKVGDFFSLKQTPADTSDPDRKTRKD